MIRGPADLLKLDVSWIKQMFGLRRPYRTRGPLEVSRDPKPLPLWLWVALGQLV